MVDDALGIQGVQGPRVQGKAWNAVRQMPTFLDLLSRIKVSRHIPSS